MNDFQVCYVCRFLWCLLVLGGCSYVVFWRDASGWWFLLAVILMEGSCKRYRQPVTESGSEVKQ